MLTRRRSCSDARPTYLEASSEASETGFDPALYDRFPTQGERPAGRAGGARSASGARPAGWRRLTAVNNNYVGIWYIGAAFLFFLLAGVLALRDARAARRCR